MAHKCHIFTIIELTYYDAFTVGLKGRMSRITTNIINNVKGKKCHNELYF